MPELFTALQQQVLALQQCVGVSGNAFGGCLQSKITSRCKSLLAKWEKCDKLR